MERKRLSFGSTVVVVLSVLLFGVSEFAFCAEDMVIVKEAYGVNRQRQLMYKGKCALALGYISLGRKGDKKDKISDHTFEPAKVIEKEGYHEYNYSKTWEEAGFSCEANTKLYPEKVVYTISYKFTKEWEGELYINPWIDGNLVIGARYKATDTDDKVLKGIITAYPEDYVFIPRGHNLKEVELLPVEGGMIRYKIENKNPFQEDPAKNPWSSNSFLVGILSIGEDGKFKTPDARINLRHIPPKQLFPAGYTNEIKLEVEFYDKMLAEEIHKPFAIACYTEQPPVIDGKLDDPVWGKAGRMERFYWSECPKTWFSIAYDKKNIYLAVESREPDVARVRKGDSTFRDGSVWQDDSIEFFIDPKASRYDYFQFIVNFSNIQLDSKRTKAKSGNLKWNAPNWSSATKQDKDRWTLETAIPFEDIGCKAPVNEIWGFNIARNRFFETQYHQRLTWSDVKGNNHNVQYYGLLVFGKLPNLVSDYLKLVEDEITTLKKEVSKVSLDGFLGSEWAKKRIQLLAAKEEKLKKQVLSKKTFSDEEAKRLFSSLHSLPEEYHGLSKFIASIKTDFKLPFINPIAVGGDRTRILAKDFSRGNAGLGKDGQYIEVGIDPKTKRGISPTRFEYNLIVEKAGTYLLRAKIAAGSYRPIKLMLDNKLITNQALSQVTGSWGKAGWFNQGAIYLTAGKHTLRFETRRSIPPLYEFELIRKEGVTAQQTLSMKFNVSPEKEDLYQGQFIMREVNCLPNDTVRIQVSCINETKKPAKAKIALWSASEKKNVKTWDVNIPGGEICPTFIAQLKLPEKLDGLYRFSMPEGIEDFGLQKSGFKGIPLKIGPKPERPAKLELELVDEIDCTKEPDEKHPYAEYRKNKARVVKGPAGKYRLSGPYFGGSSRARDVVPPNADSFGYRLTFKKEDFGKPFMIVCDVPDDAMRVFTIIYIERCNPQYAPSPGIYTGGKFPLSNKMVQLKFPCWPREEHPILMLANRLNGAGVACSRIRIYKVNPGYPFFNVKSKGRIIGTHWEEPRIPIFFGCFNPEKIEELDYGELSFELNRRRHMDAVGQVGSAWNYFEYKNYTGENAIFLPACVYKEQLFPSAILHWHQFGGQESLNDIMSMYFKIATEYDIGIIMELAPETDWSGKRPFIYPLDKKYTPSNKCPVFLVHKSGKVRPRGKAYSYNPIHPEVQEYCLSLVRELMDLYTDQPGFKGISLRVFYNYSPFVFRNLTYGYGDYTVERFQKETGIKIPEEYNQGPARFAGRHGWLLANAKEEWLNWRCVKMKEFYQHMAEIIQRKRPDVKLYLNISDPSLPRHASSPLPNHLEAGFSWRDRVRAKGIDPLMYKDDKTIICNQPYRWGVGAHYSLKGWKLQFVQDLNILPEIWSLFAGARSLVLNAAYYESGFPGKWPRGYFYPDFWNAEIGNTVSSNINPAGRNMLARYTVSMALGDCQEIYDGGNSTGSIGYGEYKREFARAFFALPNIPFKPFARQSEPVFLWQAKYEGKGYFYLANAYWCDCKVTLHVRKSGKDKLVDLSSGETIRAKKKKGDKRTYRLSLKSYEFRSFTLPKDAEIISISTEVPKKEIGRLQRIEKEIEIILGKARESMKENHAFKLALETFEAGRQALAEKRYFEAQRQFENYKLDRIYQEFGYPKGLKFLGEGQDFRLLTSGPATD